MYCLEVPGFSASLGELEQRVLDQLGAAQTRTIHELAGAIGVGRTSMHQTLRALADRGLVAREGAGPSTAYRRASPDAPAPPRAQRRRTGG